jgi:hypothetical protein
VIRRWLVLLWLSALGSAPAGAASTGIAVDRWVPAVGPIAMIGVEGADVTRFGQGAMALSFGLVRDPVRLELPSGEILSRPVRWQVSTDLSAEAGLWKNRLAFAVGLPVVLWQAGDRLRGTGVDDRPLASSAAGDLRLRLKAALLGTERLHVAALVQLTVPLGGEADFAATNGVTVEPRLIVDVRLHQVLLAAALGVRFASERQLFETSFGDELTWSFGAGARAWARRRLYLELFAEAAGAVGSSSGTRPVELRGAVRLGIWPVSLDVGAGAGVDDQVGAPAWRLFVVAHALVGRPR